MFLLLDQTEKSCDNEIKNVCGEFAVEGLRAMARGFRSFAVTVTNHPCWTFREDPSADTSSSAAEVLDSWPEKLAAWRAALYVSSVVLQSDLEIVGSSSSKPRSTRGSLSQLDRLVVGHL